MHKNRRLNLRGILLAFSLILGVAGNAWSEGKDIQQKAELKTRREPGREEQRLERLVRHELVMLPYYSVFDNLAFRIDGSTVELSGQVSRPVLKSDAEGVVKNIEGVEKIVNNIEVLPASPMDDQIRRRVYRAIYRHPAMTRYAIQAVPPVHIIVKNGNVFLEGAVATESDKNIANIQANSVSGVFSVTNNLVVEKGKS